ncbi:MAG: hypothetical protein IKN42_07245 [Elusimicrobia bacterium]|nr:hypothetical protein [Elusimicrobiota bacterium]
MKKILLLSLFICLTVCFVACTKRDKLTDNTMVLQIEQVDSQSGEMSVGNTYKFKAIIRNIKMEEIDEPVNWSVDPSDLGSFNSASSKETEFTAETTGSGTIKLSCQGVTVSVDVTVS